MKLFDLQTEKVSTLAVLSNSVWSVCSNPSGTVVYVAGQMEEIKQINMSTGEMTSSVSLSSRPDYCIVSDTAT